MDRTKEYTHTHTYIKIYTQTYTVTFTPIRIIIYLHIENHKFTDKSNSSLTPWIPGIILASSLYVRVTSFSDSEKPGF